MKTAPLRAKYPSIYERLKEKLNEHGLNVFDIHANVVTEDKSETLSVKYGKDFCEERLLTIAQNEHFVTNQALEAFLNETAEACKQQTIDDYYSFMNIRPVKIR